MPFGIGDALAHLRNAVANRAPPEGKKVDPVEQEFLERESEYVAYLSQIHGGLCTELDAEIASTQSTVIERRVLIEELRPQSWKIGVVRRIGALQTELQQLEGKLKGLLKKRSPVNSAPEFFRAQYREILRVPRVTRAWVVQPRLVYRTDGLYGLDRRNRWRRVGPFEISFDLINPSCATIQWRNLEGMKDKLHGPPNIMNNEEKNVGFVSCMGSEASNVVSAARENYDYVSIVALTVRYAECPGHVSNESLEKWPEVPVAELPLWYRETFLGK